jgi:YaiO family outer membrane protein
MPIMRTALYAVLVAGSFLLETSAIAGEGSTLRGLKPLGMDSENVSAESSSSGPGLKWRAAEAISDLAPRLTLYGGTLESRRFSVDRLDVRTSVFRPLGPSLAFGQRNLDRLHDVIPKFTLYRNVYQSLPSGWGLGFGVRQSEYNFATNSLYSLSAERYVGNFRGAYTLYSSRTEGADMGSAHRLQLNYLYGERNTVGLAYTTGRDIENLALPVGLALSDARDLTLSGRHFLSTNWALTYDLLSHEQGNLNRRQGLRLGVSRSF